MLTFSSKIGCTCAAQTSVVLTPGSTTCSGCTCTSTTWQGKSTQIRAYQGTALRFVPGYALSILQGVIYCQFQYGGVSDNAETLQEGRENDKGAAASSVCSIIPGSVDPEA